MSEPTLLTAAEAAATFRAALSPASLARVREKITEHAEKAGPDRDGRAWVELYMAYALGRPVPMDRMCAPWEPKSLGSLEECLNELSVLANLCAAGKVTREQQDSALAIIREAAAIHKAQANENLAEAIQDAGAVPLYLNATMSPEDAAEMVRAELERQLEDEFEDEEGGDE